MLKRTKRLTSQGEESDEIRINKFLSEAGVCSRREADRYIEEGKVKIDGEIAKMGSKVTKSSEVTFCGKPVMKEEKLVLIAFNKPEGVVCTTDPNEPDNIIDYISYGMRIFPIGRLDKDSEGLILLTNDGNIVNKILRAENYHEKEYIVTVNNEITVDFIKKMSGGIPILDTVTNPCQVNQIDRFTFSIILTQGLNRQIRRMCDYCGYRVVNLKRIRIMNIQLGRLKTGDYRNVTEKEIEDLNQQIREGKSRQQIHIAKSIQTKREEKSGQPKIEAKSYQQKRDEKGDQPTRYGKSNQGTRDVKGDQPTRYGKSNQETRDVKGDQPTRYGKSNQETRDVKSSQPTGYDKRDQPNMEGKSNKANREGRSGQSKSYGKIGQPAREGRSNQATHYAKNYKRVKK